MTKPMSGRMHKAWSHDAVKSDVVGFSIALSITKVNYSVQAADSQPEHTDYIPVVHEIWYSGRIFWITHGVSP